MAEDYKILHLQLIQGVINRLAQDSFWLKGWSVTITTALLAAAASMGKIIFVYLSFFPVFAFWVLDAYYLWQERLFRALYDDVRVKNEAQIDFSLKIEPFYSRVPGWLRLLFSKTIIIFHGAVIFTLVVTLIIVCQYRG